MTAYLRNSAAIAAIAATLSLAALPARAADLPVPAVTGSPVGADAGWEAGHDIANRYRHRRYRRNRGVDAGDVLAGVLVLGTIAAVASAATRNDRDRNRARDYRYDRRSSERQTDSSGLNRAVDICVREIERDLRVDGVSNVARTAAGWQVDGSLYDGQGFSCRIGNDGRIDDIDYGPRGRMSASSYSPVNDRQFSDDTYARAWTDVEPQGRLVYSTSVQNTQNLPAYPGGPVDGDLYPGESAR